MMLRVWAKRVKGEMREGASCNKYYSLLLWCQWYRKDGQWWFDEGEERGDKCMRKVPEQAEGGPSMWEKLAHRKHGQWIQSQCGGRAYSTWLQRLVSPRTQWRENKEGLFWYFVCVCQWNKKEDYQLWVNGLYFCLFRQTFCQSQVSCLLCFHITIMNNYKMQINNNALKLLLALF